MPGPGIKSKSAAETIETAFPAADMDHMQGLCGLFFQPADPPVSSFDCNELRDSLETA